MGYESEIKKLEVRWQENPKQYFAPLADAYRKNGDFEKAIELIGEGLSERPNYVSAYIVLGRTRVGLEDHAEAARVFEQVLEFDGENIIALSQLAEIAEKTDNIDGAIGWLRRLVDVDPMNQAATRLAQLENAAGIPDEPVAAEVSETTESTGEEGLSFADVLNGDSDSSSEEEPVEVESLVTETPAPTETTDDLAPVESGLDSNPVEDPNSQERKLALDEIPTVVDMPAVDPDLKTEQTDESMVVQAEDVETIVDQNEVPTLQMVGISDEQIAEVEEPDGSEPLESGDPSAEEEPVGSDSDVSDVVEGVSHAQVEFVEPDVAPIESLAEEISRDHSEDPAVAPADEMQNERPSQRASRALENIPVIMPSEMDGGFIQMTSSSDDEPSPEPVVTETMAQVFAQQGMYDQAKQVYEQLLDDQPDNARFRAELEKLETMADTPLAGVEKRVSRLSVVETGGESSRSFLQGLLSSSINVDVAAVDPVKPFAGPEEPNQPRSRLSFDDFYGATREAEPTSEAEDESAPDEDFKDWLKGLKS